MQKENPHALSSEALQGVNREPGRLTQVVSSCDGGLPRENRRKVEEDEQEQIDDEEREERVTQLSSPKEKGEGKEGWRGAEEEEVLKPPLLDTDSSQIFGNKREVKSGA